MSCRENSTSSAVATEGLSSMTRIVGMGRLWSRLLDPFSRLREKVPARADEGAFRHAPSPQPLSRYAGEGLKLHAPGRHRSDEHTSELQSLMRISYAVLCLKKKTNTHKH